MNVSQNRCPPAQIRPPCLVLGIDTQIGLSVIRELGRSGLRVIGLANREGSIGLASRYLERGIVVGRQRDQRLISILCGLGNEYGEAVLLAISERDIDWLIAHRGDLSNIRAVTPPSAAFRHAIDKARTLATASALGIHVPRTFSAKSLEMWRAAVTQVDYPVVVKWPDPLSVIDRLKQHGVPYHKIEYALDKAALLRIGERFAPVGHWPLIQEYCPGTGLGQFFFIHQGQVLRRFQHRRIAEWPPEGGFSSVCEAVPISQHQELQEQSITLLRSIGWDGCAMVEYRLDQATGDAVLMEINGRFWGSFPLAVHSGAGFASLAYHVQGLGEIPSLPPIRDNLRCRMVSTEVKRLFRIMVTSGKITDPFYVCRPGHELVRFISDFMKPNVRYYLWATDDLAPFWADLGNYARRLLAIRKP